MKGFIGLAACAFLAWGAVADAETGFLDRSLSLNGQIHKYEVYVPSAWTRAQQWPVILYLHSNNYQGLDGRRQMTDAGASSLVAAIQADRMGFPAIVIFPQAPPDAGWRRGNTPAIVLAELEASLSEFNGDMDRIYLWGFSMGGEGVLSMAARQPSRFAAIVDVAGPPAGPRNMSQERTEQDRAAYPYLAAPDPVVALAAIIGRLPIWVFHSDTDTVVAVEQSRRLVTALRGYDPDVRYTEYSGMSHTETGAKVPTEKDVVTWLLAQRRKAGTN